MPFNTDKSQMLRSRVELAKQSVLQVSLTWGTKVRQPLSHLSLKIYTLKPQWDQLGFLVPPVPAPRISGGTFYC